MAMSDPIADMLTRIRNANVVRAKMVEVPGSRIKRELAAILKDEGYIEDCDFIDDGRQGVIRLHLKYAPERDRVITGLRRISRPGLRVYAGKDELPRVLGGLGIAVLSTSRGLMTDRRARKEGVGGEVLCYVW
ncbi:MAG: 30S ribosomal protein S8 [Patescibacteria group bacterium]